MACEVVVVGYRFGGRQKALLGVLLCCGWIALRCGAAFGSTLLLQAWPTSTTRTSVCSRGKGMMCVRPESSVAWC